MVGPSQDFGVDGRRVELRSDFSSMLRVARLDRDVAPFAFLSRAGAAAWGPRLATSADGVVTAYFATLPPPESAGVGVYTRVVEQDKLAPRRRAARH